MKKGERADPNRPLSPRHEAFVAALASGKSNRDAARAAGFRISSIDTLLTNPRIQKALTELREKIRERATFDADAAFRELNSAIDEARAAKQYTAAVKALELKLKLVGLLIERQATVQVTLRSHEQMTDMIDRAEERLLEAGSRYLELSAEPVEPDVDIFEE